MTTWAPYFWVDRRPLNIPTFDEKCKLVHRYYPEFKKAVDLREPKPTYTEAVEIFYREIMRKVRNIR